MLQEQENQGEPQDNREMDESVVSIPDTVRDEEAYKRYLELKNLPILKKENREIQTSDEDLIVDPLIFPYVLNEKISHLPLSEQEDIKRRAKGLKAIQAKLTNEHMKAFGTPKRNRTNSLERVLLDERSAELIEYFGRFFTVEEVHKIVTIEWGYSVQIRGLNQFRTRNLDKITARQEHHRRDYGEIRLSHKKSRLEELQDLYGDRKNRYNTTKTERDYKLLLQTLKLIKDECEVDTLRLEGNINHNVEVTLNYHIEQEVMKGLTINDIIIARVAARNGISSTFLIERLHNSIYSKFSGFTEPEDPTNPMNQEIQYPSQMIYNWDEIRKTEKAKVKEDKSLMEHISIPENKKEEMREVKSVLQQKLDELRTNKNRSVQRVQQAEINREQSKQQQ